MTFTSVFVDAFTSIFDLMKTVFCDVKQSIKQIIIKIAETIDDPDPLLQFLAIPFKVVTAPVVHVSWWFEDKAQVKARATVISVGSSPSEGQHLPDYFRFWRKSLHDNLTDELTSWADQTFSVYEYPRGVKIAFVNSSQADKFHEHNRMQYAHIKLFGLLPYWFQVRRDCSKETDFLLSLSKKSFWWDIGVAHRTDAFNSFGLSAFEKLLTSSSPTDSEALWGLSAQTLKNALDSLSPDYSWVDLHNLYYHSDVFAADHGFDNIPVEYIRKVLHVPETLAAR